VLLLDEPASGLDPDARHELAALFLDLQADGMTLLVSSHILAELSDYSSRMMILREGSILEHRALEDFASPAREIHLRLAHGAPELRERLSATEGIEDLRIEGLVASFRFAGDEAEQGALLRRLVEAGLPVCAFGEARANLQDLYLEKVKDRDEEVAP
jgi:ABC-2 type transport system ATP-binding protein